MATTCAVDEWEAAWSAWDAIEHDCEGSAAGTAGRQEDPSAVQRPRKARRTTQSAASG